MKTFSLGTFLRKYKDNDACLQELFDLRFPQGAYCENEQKVSKFYKVTDRPVYQCSCGYQISPLAGTIFEKTTTPLQYWFYAMFLMANTRSGVSAKQLQRELGVTYKTAWRMFKQIRILMAGGGDPLDGDVEVDETFVGGKGKNRKDEWQQGIYGKEKEVVMGMVKRGGKVYLKHVPNTGKWTLINQVRQNVDSTARVFTDQWGAYVSLPQYGYGHESVNHGIGEYVRGEAHTQNIENVWSTFKRGIHGVYRVVSKKYLQAYADEYEWRYNHRKQSQFMFKLLLNRVAETKVLEGLISF